MMPACMGDSMWAKFGLTSSRTRTGGRNFALGGGEATSFAIQKFLALLRCSGAGGVPVIVIVSKTNRLFPLCDISYT